MTKLLPLTFPLIIEELRPEDTPCGRFSFHHIADLDADAGVAQRAQACPPFPGKKEWSSFRHKVMLQPDEGQGLVRDGHAVDAALLAIGGLPRPDRQIEVEPVEGGGGLFALTDPTAIDGRCPRYRC